MHAVKTTRKLTISFFKNRSSEIGLFDCVGPVACLSISMADMDGDRYPELLLGGDFKGGTWVGSRYFRNDSGAGFADVTLESFERELLVGGGVDLERTVDFALRMGPAGAALREAGDAARLTTAESVREALAPYLTPDGVRMPSASWFVSAGV